MTPDCDARAVARMDAAVGEWSRHLGSIDNGLLRTLLAGPRLDLHLVRQLAREIEHASAALPE